jgi:hypothetical protein
MDNTIVPHVYPAPPARPPRLSVEAEASLMNRGRGRQLWGLAAGALLLVATVVALMQRVTRGDGYSSASASISQIEREQFDAFFGCALPDARVSELSGPRLTSALTSQAERTGKAYSNQLQGCMKHVQALDVRVRSLSVPAAVKPQHEKLIAAATALARSTTTYSSYLANPSRDFELGVARPMIEQLAAGWAGYRAAQVKLEQALELHR